MRKMKIKKKLVLIIFVLIGVVVGSIILLQITAPKEPQCYGLYLGQNLDSSVLKSSAEKYGVNPCVILTFIGWGDRPFADNLKDIQTIKDSGAIPMITLEPWFNPSQEAVSLQDIASGKEDVVIEELAAMLKQVGIPVFLRFAHEMNGDWYPWSGAKNAENGGDYINAYRRVHDIITSSATGTSISWVWGINAEDRPKKDWNDPMSYYPGNDYVDAIGIDGYNPDKISFNKIFKDQINHIKDCLPDKPIYITEVASAGIDTDKSGWIKSFFGKFSRKYNFVPVFIWFDVDKEKNWSIKNDPLSAEAFKSGLQKLNNRGVNTLWKK